MQWIAPSEKDTANDTLEKRLWAAADQLRANSGLTAQQYSAPVLGLIFLRFAEVRFDKRRAELKKAEVSARRGSRLDDPTAYHAESVLYLSEKARFDTLLNLPEGADVGKAVNEAMTDIEKQNPQLAGVLPRTYQVFSSTLLKELLKKVSEIPSSVQYDAFGRIYEYFLGEFARTEGSKGGEFYTPASIVRLIVEILEPYHGRVLDPACGSGGMFVQSARFMLAHRSKGDEVLRIHGVEKTDETGRLCRMNLAIHGLEGDIRHGGEINSYYDDPFDACGASLEPSTRPVGRPSPTGRRDGDEGAPTSVVYRDVPGLCRAATIAEVEQQGWSLNPGRYVGVAPGEEISDEDFKEQLEAQNEELETLNAQARELEKTIAKNVAEILET